MINKYEKTVRKVLIESDLAKDDDKLLYLGVLFYLGYDVNTTIIDWAFGKSQNYSQVKYPSFETLSRCRRKVQEKYPETRGKNYIKRHKLAQEVKYEMGL